MKTLTLTLILALASTGCSLTKEGRRERAHRKYITKHTKARAKQSSKPRSNKPSIRDALAPRETIESSETAPPVQPDGSLL